MRAGTSVINPGIYLGWHYAVLILNIAAMVLITCGIAVAALQYRRQDRKRLVTILFTGFISMAAIVLGVSLMVFVINAEMLESKFLIGVRNTFQKYYGYSFYLSCFACLLLVFSAFGAILVTAFTFFLRSPPEVVASQLSSTVQDYNYQPTKLPPEDLRIVVNRKT
ncbi:hypothetical protein OESDEN_03666 [Oesophagostomum dentatum]|uniref:Clc-like protein n=1 Tax=Oesophagostomum dentatum TaxID=61180 RepID=A0A0B1TLT2_OESDE|nr:hypothetical protein OESDEN_03666 [Oesophagostomum dentatum]